ncbi:VWA domain-containing protein [Paenibacillaceae bacterium]|nr:VWA domain-containing protein [Paenibacillaceae bacterium]
MRLNNVALYAARIALLLALVLTLAIGPASAAFAASQTSVKQASSAPQIDAVLVLDVSHSMTTSDPGKIGNEAMKMFIDMLPAQGDRVGVVAFTDQVEREKALLEIKTAADKQNLKTFIDQLNRGSYTDVAIGVKEAVQILESGSDPDHEPMIILLADGNNDFNPKSGRTSADSNKELEQALAKANDKGIPVHTIGLNANGKLNKEALAALSDKTGGKSFSTDTADDLPQILSQIFAHHMELNVVPIDSFTADGNYQNVTVTVPNANVLEANISIMSAKPVEARLLDPSGTVVPMPSDEVLLSQSTSYSLIKLLSPAEGDWTLQVKGVAKDKIDINLIFNYDLELELDSALKPAYAQGDRIDVRASLMSGGNKLQDPALYSNMKAFLLVKDLDTGGTERIPMNAGGDGFEGSYTVAEKHDYEIVVRAEEASFYRETDPASFSAKSSGNTAPPSSGASDKPFPLIPVLLAALGLVVLLVIAYFVMRYLKQANRGFVGQFVIEMRDENTGEKSFPQYKKLSGFKGKFTLHHLLQLAPELKETERIQLIAAGNDRIMLRNGSACTIEKSGRAIDASGGFELKSGDRLTIPLQQVDKTILLEYLV